MTENLLNIYEKIQSNLQRYSFQKITQQVFPYRLILTNCFFITKSQVKVVRTRQKSKFILQLVKQQPRTHGIFPNFKQNEAGSTKDYDITSPFDEHPGFRTEITISSSVRTFHHTKHLIIVFVWSSYSVIKCGCLRAREQGQFKNSVFNCFYHIEVVLGCLVDVQMYI